MRPGVQTCGFNHWAQPDTAGDRKRCVTRRIAASGIAEVGAGTTGWTVTLASASLPRHGDAPSQTQGCLCTGSGRCSILGLCRIRMSLRRTATPDGLRCGFRVSGMRRTGFLDKVGSLRAAAGSRWRARQGDGTFGDLWSAIQAKKRPPGRRAKYHSEGSLSDRIGWDRSGLMCYQICLKWDNENARCVSRRIAPKSAHTRDGAFVHQCSDRHIATSVTRIDALGGLRRILSRNSADRG